MFAFKRLEMSFLLIHVAMCPPVLSKKLEVFMTKKGGNGKLIREIRGRSSKPNGNMPVMPRASLVLLVFSATFQSVASAMATSPPSNVLVKVYSDLA